MYYDVFSHLRVMIMKYSMKEGVRRCKIQDEIEIVIILAIVNKSLINFDINSIIVMASPRYFSATCIIRRK